MPERLPVGHVPLPPAAGAATQRTEGVLRRTSTVRTSGSTYVQHGEEVCLRSALTTKSLSRQRRLCTTRPTYDSVGASRTRTRCVVLVPGVSVELARPPSPQSFLRDRPGTVYDAINVPQCRCVLAHTRGGWQWLAAGGRACPQRVQLSRVAWVARERLHVTGCERWGGRTNIPRGSPQVERSAEPEVPRPSHAAARHSPHTLGSALSA